MISDYRPTTPFAGEVCDYHPHPESRLLPRCWSRSSTHRAKLGLAVATLQYYGVTTVPRYDGEPDRAREHIVGALRAHYPDGIHSYIFWTAADDRTSFAVDGTLTQDLTLHHSADIVPAIVAALDAHGLRHRPGKSPQTTSLISP